MFHFPRITERFLFGTGFLAVIHFLPDSNLEKTAIPGLLFPAGYSQSLLPRPQQQNNSRDTKMTCQLLGYHSESHGKGEGEGWIIHK